MPNPSNHHPGHVAALAYLVNAIRPGWHRAGIEAVIRSINPSTEWAAICHAAIVAAVTREDQATPAVIGMGGAHWTPCTGHKPVNALPTWRDRYADTIPADPDQIARIRGRKEN